MTHTVPWDASQVLPWRAGLAYGLLGLPLAFAALPLYVVLPHYYASNLGLPLASVGALLLLVRPLQRLQPLQLPQTRFPQVRWRFQRRSGLLL